MSDPKVLHAWVDGGGPCRVVDHGHDSIHGEVFREGEWRAGLPVSSPRAIANLARENAELKAAVRWVGKKEPHWYASWTVAHPIVREVIEKGGE